MVANRASEADAESVQSLRQAFGSVRLHEQVHVVRLDTEMRDARAEPLARRREGLEDGAPDGHLPEARQASGAAERDVHGMA